MFASENELRPDFRDPSQLLWLRKDLVYGDWYAGPNGDGQFTTQVTIPLSSVS